MKEGVIIKVNESEEPPSVLIQFEDGTVTEYSIEDLVGMFVTEEKGRPEKPANYDRG